MYIFRSVDAPESLQLEPRQTFKRSNVDFDGRKKKKRFAICLLGANINENTKNVYEQLATNTNTHDY